jgi:hypothetical protein
MRAWGTRNTAGRWRIDRIDLRQTGQRQDLRQQHENTQPGRRGEGHAPAQGAAEQGTGRHAQDRADRNAGEDDGHGPADLIRRHHPARQRCADRPESADTDAEQNAPDQQHRQIGAEGHDEIGDDDQAAQQPQQVPPVEASAADHQGRRRDGGDEARNRHQKPCLTVRDVDVGGDPRQQADRQELRRHQGEGAEGDGGDGEPIARRSFAVHHDPCRQFNT